MTIIEENKETKAHLSQSWTFELFIDWTIVWGSDYIKQSKIIK